MKIFKSKWFKTVATTCVLCAVVCIPALADTVPVATVDIVTPMKTALSDTVTTTVQCFSAVIPIGLTIFACRFAWMKGINFFSKIASKS